MKYSSLYFLSSTDTKGLITLNINLSLILVSIFTFELDSILGLTRLMRQKTKLGSLVDLKIDL